MSQKFENLKVRLDENLEEKIALLVPQYSSFRILKKSVDARRRSDVHYVYSLEIYGQNETPKDDDYEVERINYSGSKPIIIGAGPAGLFAAVRLVERGIPCILLERGSIATERLKGINQYWRYGKLDPNNNVCFGEGGAGLYSDGKLITRIKSPYIPYVLHRLVKFGAPAEIQYLSNPHVGSDRIRRVIPKIREYLLANGCEIHFDTKVTEILTERKRVVGVKCENGKEFRSDFTMLANGHSARDMFEHLREIGVFMEGKSFAVGLRIEHPQKLINQTQFRTHADDPQLGAANYKLTHFDEETRIGVYSFCMCPGGYVLAASTDADGVVCNGMSNYHRNSPFANAAIVVSIDFDTHFKRDIFDGFAFQTRLERGAKKLVEAAGGTKQIPVQKAVDFMEGRMSKESLPSSTPSGVVPVRLDELLPKFMVDNLREGLMDFESKLPGFLGDQAQLHGVESRTSCPVRVTRNPETMESISHEGLYPVGEGAGYAGGITSAAVDGIKAAEAIVTLISSQKTLRT